MVNVHFAVDPANPANAASSTSTKRPATSGKVRFEPDFVLLQPADAARGQTDVCCTTS